MRKKPIHSSKKNIDRSKEIKRIDGWRISPFENLEQKLPINVIQIDEWSEQANRIVCNPELNWPERYTPEARGFKKKGTTRDLRYYVRSLVNTADCLSVSDDVPDLMFMNGDVIEIDDGWNGVLSSVLLYLVQNRQEQLFALEVSGLMGWIIKGNAKLGLKESIESGSCSIHFDSLSKLCEKVQWLLLMAGFNLDMVALRFRRTDVNVNQLKRKLREQMDEKIRQDRLYNEYRNKLLKQVGVSDKRVRIDKNFVNRRKNLDTQQKISRPIRQSFSNQIRFDQGTYIVQDGVVVFVKRNNEEVYGSGNNNIMRSNIETPDEWKGFGVARPESDGRFGGIISEDWAE